MTSVAVVRSYVRVRGKRARKRAWYDWYAIVFAVGLAALLLFGPLRAPLSRLTAPAGSSAPAQASAGFAVVVVVAAGLVLLVQAFGPLAVAPADASWLLMSPLERRAVLRRPVVVLALTAALAGAALGVLGLAMAAPFLPPGAGRLLGSAALSGAALSLSAVGVAVLAGLTSHGTAWVRWACLGVSGAGVVAALLGTRWGSFSRDATSWMHGASARDAAMIAVAAVVVALAVAIGVWRKLPVYPASVLLSSSARASTALAAAAFLNVPLLTWTAEDRHWQRSRLTSRRWPRLPSAAVLAWADWRRMARRPGLLAVLAASAVAPALAGAAIAGHARGITVAAALAAGAIVAALSGTAGTRRDTEDPALGRLLGASGKTVRTLRAVLPAGLSGVWLVLALAILAAARLLPGWWWPPLGLLAGPGAATGAMRMARTSPIDWFAPAVDTPMGALPQWLTTRVLSVIIAVAGCLPLLRAVLAGRLSPSTFAAQALVANLILTAYVSLTGSAARRNS